VKKSKGQALKAFNKINPDECLVAKMIQALEQQITITADIGSVGVVPQGLGEAYVNQHVALIRPKPKAVEPLFLACAAKSPWGRLHFDESMQGGY